LGRPGLSERNLEGGLSPELGHVRLELRRRGSGALPAASANTTRSCILAPPGQRAEISPPFEAPVEHSGGGHDLGADLRAGDLQSSSVAPGKLEGLHLLHSVERHLLGSRRSDQERAPSSRRCEDCLSPVQSALNGLLRQLVEELGGNADGSPLRRFALSIFFIPIF